jgi:hypothetical protein
MPGPVSTFIPAVQFAYSRGALTLLFVIQPSSSAFVGKQINNLHITPFHSFIHPFYLHSGDPNTGVTTP